MKPTPILDDNACYQAVLDRDRTQDGKFVTAVRTTGIYCRPSCPARTPKRENVTFYRTPAEAEAAGFRPCKRCSPNTQAFEADLAEQICRYIDAHLDQRLSLDQLGSVVVISPQHLQRMFKRTLGISPREYIAARRLDHLKTRLKAGDTVTEALYDAGFSSSSRLYENAPEKLGMTPADYKSGAQGLAIRYTIAPSSLGYVLAAATNKGICAVMLDDEPDTMVEKLHDEFHGAHITADSDSLREPLDGVLAYIEGQQPHLELPLDIRGTAFQQRVWQALQAIPYGETRTYSEIAEAMGQPEATRAVASAIANNHIAVVIPCHRVIRQDGTMGGYKWGLARKQALLQREHEQA
ncbi:MAG: bifunctional DNA-binding transcriptional regulator/O6-methylguanine-DNA methyltransferase Ada [Anaerolineaceae bacterium]|nr:bifunctional DNA-binding transcriptional regulator/O6-methylguanine-DNA methyltransferase Ada [Anaerolineaceae bacterium]